MWQSLYLVPIFLVFCLVFAFSQIHHTQASINPYINFQGKLTNPDGTNLTNGTYTIVFSLYTVASGGSNVWTESKSVTVSDGIFQTSLGDTTALPGSVDFNTGTLYLGVKVGTDAEMTPRVALTAAPYAFNTDKLNGLSSSGYVQLAQGVQTDASTTNPSIGINKTGATAAIVQIQKAGVDVFTIANNGSVAVTGAFTDTLAVGNQAAFVASAAPTSDLVRIDNTGQAVATAGANGLQINYVGGSGAIEASAAQIDLTPGGTSGATWNGLKIVANATGAASGVTQYGINLDGPTSPGAGSEVGLSIDANWDAGLQIGSKTSEPGTPPADNIYVYARKVAGRSMLRQKGPSGVSFAYQPAFFEQAITYEGPNTGATLSTFGSSWTVDTTASHPAASEIFGYATNFATAATANDTAGVAEALTQHYRGSVANGSNGFFYVARLGLPDANYGAGATGARIWTGLTSGTAASMTNADNPAGNYAGFQYSTNRGDTAWQFVSKDNVTQSTPVATLAIAQNKVYDFYIYTPPQGTTVYWRIDNITDGTTQEGTTTTNLPINSTAMRAGTSLQTLTTTIRNIRVLKHYVESDR